MKISLIMDVLADKSKWGCMDLRGEKRDFIKMIQKSLTSFSPVSPNTFANNPIQLIDFFCGAGGTSLGFAAVNSILPAFKMLGGCDINKVSATTYSYNYGTPLIHEDITKLAYEDGALEACLTKIGYDPGAPTVLIGCAPCQGFSSHRKKHWHEEDDIRNSLIMAFAEIVKKLQPEVIIMENVPEFLSQRYWKYFSSAKKIYEENGYIVRASIFNAASFGVPQERFRSIIMGMKKEFVLPEGYLQPGEYRTVRDAISHLPVVSAGVAASNDPMHKSAAHKQSTIDIIRQVPHDGGNRPAGVGPECLNKTKGFSDVYGRLYWDRPSITITHYARNPASGRYIHPEQDRGLTAREAAILQSFPDGFVFTGKSDDIYRQIGEAVPPMLSSAVAANVLIELLSAIPTEEEISSSPSSIVEPVSSSYSSVIAGIKTRKKAGR
ncbi:DNA cytosine methyltransferase [Ventrimonas sp. CLA-AP-H27]|uniref:DNA (cytosine-5-)-methyltransferase n=1 Tax=Ventrimonas faecis TaxID=3133170 RepID=A0ABV1HP59_9FIRM